MRLQFGGWQREENERKEKMENNLRSAHKRRKIVKREKGLPLIARELIRARLVHGDQAGQSAVGKQEKIVGRPSPLLAQLLIMASKKLKTRKFVQVSR